jgi:hypothetical protein
MTSTPPSTKQRDVDDASEKAIAAVLESVHQFLLGARNDKAGDTLHPKTTVEEAVAKIPSKKTETNSFGTFKVLNSLALTNFIVAKHTKAIPDAHDWETAVRNALEYNLREIGEDDGWNEFRTLSRCLLLETAVAQSS